MQLVKKISKCEKNYKNSRNFFRYTNKTFKPEVGISLRRYFYTKFYPDRLWSPQITSYLIGAKGSVKRVTAAGLNFAFLVFVLSLDTQTARNCCNLEKLLHIGPNLIDK
jgi:hypothetical protein